MRYRILDPHLTPNLFGSGIHNYVIDLCKITDGAKFTLSGINSHRKVRLLAKFLLTHLCISLKALRLSKNKYIALSFNHFLDWPNHKYERLVLHCNDYFYQVDENEFRLKIAHLQPNLLMGYTDHNIYSPYFRSLIIDLPILEVPFGFTARFRPPSSDATRAEKCLLVGAIERNENLSCHRFYTDRGEEYFHPERAALRLALEDVQGGYEQYFENFFPRINEIRGKYYDLVKAFQSNAFFFCGLSIEMFPPAKLFEGAACGCIPIIHGEINDKRWIDGVNCLFIETVSAAKIVRKLQSITPELRSSLSDNAYKLAMEHYTHKKIAEDVIRSLNEVFSL